MGIPARSAGEQTDLTPLDFMLALMRNPKTKAAVRFEAAKSAAPLRPPATRPDPHRRGATDRAAARCNLEILKS
jgi:hypothetical protein